MRVAEPKPLTRNRKELEGLKFQSASRASNFGSSHKSSTTKGRGAVESEVVDV